MFQRPRAIPLFVTILAVAAAGCGGGTTNSSGSTVTFAAPVSQTGAFGQAEGRYTPQGDTFCVPTHNSKVGIRFGGQ